MNEVAIQEDKTRFGNNEQHGFVLFTGIMQVATNGRSAMVQRSRLTLTSHLKETFQQVCVLWIEDKLKSPAYLSKFGGVELKSRKPISMVLTTFIQDFYLKLVCSCSSVHCTSKLVVKMYELKDKLMFACRIVRNISSPCSKVTRHRPQSIQNSGA